MMMMIGCLTANKNADLQTLKIYTRVGFNFVKSKEIEKIFRLTFSADADLVTKINVHLPMDELDYLHILNTMNTGLI